MVRHEAPIRSQYRRRKLLSYPYRNLRASKTTFFLKKFLHLFFAAALRPAGGLSSFSPSTPLPQHREPKNDTVFQKNFLLYNRSLHPSKNDIQFCFLENFLYYLNNNIKGLENDGELQLFQKVSLLSYRNIERSFFNPRFKKISNITHPLNSHIGSRKTTAKRNCFFKLSFHLPTT